MTTTGQCSLCGGEAAYGKVLCRDCHLKSQRMFDGIRMASPGGVVASPRPADIMAEYERQVATLTQAYIEQMRAHDRSVAGVRVDLVDVTALGSLRESVCVHVRTDVRSR